MKRRHGGLRVAVLCALATTLHACGGSTRPAPVAGDTRGFVPDLSGARVMVFPVQVGMGVPGDLEAELAFALRSRAPAVAWVLPDELRRAAGNAPGYDVVVDDLPVAIFLQAEVRNIGDPLYGYLRRLGALVDADAALIPVLARYRAAAAPDSSGSETAEDAEVEPIPSPGRAELTAALVSLVTGRVHWFGVVGGEPGSPSDPGVMASAFDALGRRFAPPGAR